MDLDPRPCGPPGKRARRCAGAPGNEALPGQKGLTARSSIGSGRSAADGEALDLQGGLPDAHRHALTVLPASADSRIELEVAADHGDLGQDIRAVADEGGPLDRRADLAVVDQIGL